ncbi:MAG: formyltransferase family protein [Bdellovibrionota bacterium]
MKSCNILIFASKEIGLNLIQFLLKSYSDDYYDFVVMDPDAEKIQNYLRSRDIKFYSPKSYRETLIKSGKEYDWILNLWGGMIFKKEDLELAKNTLNVHPSFLPYGRGRDPVVWALKYGHPAGVTLHSISGGIDEGDIYVQQNVSYDFQDKGKKVYNEVVETCEALFKENWDGIRSGKITLKPQAQQNLLTKKRSDLLQDRIIDLDKSLPATELIKTILAHDFSPDYTAQLRLNGKTYRITLDIEEI